MSTFVVQRKFSKQRVLSAAAVAACLVLLLAITARAYGADADTSSSSALAAAAAPGARDAYQWDLTEPGMARVAKPYFFVNKRNNGVLGYKSRPLGINLGWVSRNGPGNWTFSRQNTADTQPIREGELVALRNATGGFVYYGRRTWGINLNWSSTPRYEWTVSKRDGLFALRNEVTHDFLVYGVRPIGVNLCWLQDIVWRVCVPN